MKIDAAVKAAVKKEGHFTRKNFLGIAKIKPANPCRLIDEKKGDVGAWNPGIEDLQADDWIIS